MLAKGADELLDSTGKLRGPWRRMLGTLLGMGMATLRDRTAELERACLEEGAAALIAVPKADSWRCDPIPFLITEAEFSVLAQGLAQRASLFEMMLADLYGPRRLIQDGHLPPSMVYPASAYLRTCRTVMAGGQAVPRHIHLYAADLVRRPDGQWCVLSDRTGIPYGLAYALENRRMMARVLPELFRGMEVAQLRPFFDGWQDVLQRMAPAHAVNPGLALLTPGHEDPRWFEHVVLARALGCALVEDADLTVRDGALWLKTLTGLQPVHVLLRRLRGGALDNLEPQATVSTTVSATVSATGSAAGSAAGPSGGTPGLLTAWRDGAVQVLNGPGSSYAEAPGLACFLPGIARALTGLELALPGLDTLWLGDDAARARVLAGLGGFQIVSATERGEAALLPAAMTTAGLAALRAEIEARPWAFAAVQPPLPSFAPCVGQGETLDPKPLALRLFLVWDGARWRPLPGGLARVLDPAEASGGSLPRTAMTKDVWVLREEGMDIYGPANLSVPALPIRRVPGDMPSRVADNFYWLGRYLERLEHVARLTRIVLGRLSRDTLLPRDVPDMEALTACLAEAGIVSEELTAGGGGVHLADLLLRALARDHGVVARLTARVRELADTLRDRLSGEMHATIAQDLRRLKGNRMLLRPDQREVGIGLMIDFASQVLQFCATVAGYAAENMVRGGGRLFLDLGRRIERGQAVAADLAQALEPQHARPEAGHLEASLSLCLELCDSTLTYRSRYLTAVQAAPVIDLVVADDGNPRGLAYQLLTARAILIDIAAGGAPSPLAHSLDGAIAETRQMVDDLAADSERGAFAATLPPRLRAIEAQMAALSDAVIRQYFALLPVTFTGGLQ